MWLAVCCEEEQRHRELHFFWMMRICPGGICHGGICLGGFVRGDFVREGGGGGLS